MNTQKKKVWTFLGWSSLYPLAAALTVALAAGCAGAQTKPTAAADIRSTPQQQETIVVRDIKPPEGGTTVNDVRIKFLDVPLELSLQKTGPGTWERKLTRDEASLLSPSGLSPSGQITTHPAKVYIDALSYGGPLPTTERPIQVKVQPAA